jgi:hypothetical protein
MPTDYGNNFSYLIFKHFKTVTYHIQSDQKEIKSRVLKVLDSLMGCDLGHICAKADKPMKNL